MKKSNVWIWMYLLVTLSVLQAEEPVRRRRRFIVYDQQPRQIRGEALETAVDEEQAEERRRMLERQAAVPGQSALEPSIRNPVLPLSPLSPSQALRQEVEEEEEEDWISAEDLLGEEDLLEMNPEEASPEIEIMAWEDLQKELIKEEMTGETAEQARQEEMIQDEELRAEWSGEASEGRTRLEDREQASGLTMDSMMEVSDEEGLAAVESESAQMSDPVMTAPVLQPVLLTGDRGVPTIGNPDRAAGEEFSGSRKILQELQGRWDPRETRGAGPSASARAARPDRPSPATAWNQPLQAQPLPAQNLNRDASPLPGSSALPGSPGLTRQPPSAPAPQQAPARREPRTRIQSRLGAGSGF